jgi:hypothetical protein
VAPLINLFQAEQGLFLVSILVFHCTLVKQGELMNRSWLIKLVLGCQVGKVGY